MIVPTKKELTEATPENWRELFAKASDDDIVELAARDQFAEGQDISRKRAIVERDRRQREAARSTDAVARRTLVVGWLTLIAALLALVATVLGIVITLPH